MNARRASIALAGACIALASAGCVTVHPYERGLLASPCMDPAAGSTRLGDAYRAKVLESKTGGGLPGTAPGGGCGCTQ